MCELYDAGVDPTRLTVHLHWDGLLSHNPRSSALANGRPVTSSLQQGLKKKKSIEIKSIRYYCTIIIIHVFYAKGVPLFSEADVQLSALATHHLIRRKPQDLNNAVVCSLFHPSRSIPGMCA